MSVYHQDGGTTLYHGDCLEIARTLESGMADCIVTSPPYFGLRDYGHDGQYGLEESPIAYVETMRALCSELLRVLADDGTLWLNLGDSYGKGKQLLGTPWRVALALKGDGWILRNEIIWAKPNGVPESVRDRFAKKHEHLFLFAKNTSYHFDLDAVREPYSEASLSRYKSGYGGGKDRLDAAHLGGDRRKAKTIVPNAKGKNPGDVWGMPTSTFKGAHFAVMPPALAERCILAGSRPGGVVLDPFSGSGTTGEVARANGRKYVGIDISEAYLKLSLETRLQNAAIGLEEAA